jgi:hypothetical protein
MCTGLEAVAIASAVAAAGGTVLQSQAASKAAKTEAAARQTELARQQKIRREAEAVFANSERKQTINEQAVDRNAKQQQREAAYAGVVSDPSLTGYAPATAPSAAPEVIGAEYKKAGTAAARYGKQQGIARANLDSIGDQQTVNDIFGQQQRRKLSQIGGFSEWSKQALDAELQAARARAASPLGDLLVSLGKSGLSASAGGLFGAPGAATGAPTNILPPGSIPTTFVPGVPFTPLDFAPSSFTPFGLY